MRAAVICVRIVLEKYLVGTPLASTFTERTRGMNGDQKENGEKEFKVE